MNEKFAIGFTKRHPGMEFGGPTWKDEFELWLEGYVAGCDHTLEIFMTTIPTVLELQA